jgi:ketosteroid isomerase-like protein
LGGVDAVRELEQARISAMLKGDARAIADFLDDDLIYIHSSGVVDSKESYLKSLDEGRYVYEAIEVIGERHACGPGFVVFAQVLSVKIRVGSSPAQRREVASTSMWKQSGSRWTLVAMQATPRSSAASSSPEH